MTHLYTLLLGGTVVTGGDEPDVTAIAWAEDTVLALGGDDEVRAISRGDSHLVDLRGATVVPLGAGDAPGWPLETRLEVGGRADLAVLDGDPRPARDGSRGTPTGPPPRPLAIVRAGRLVAGALPGWTADEHEAPPHEAHPHEAHPHEAPRHGSPGRSEHRPGGSSATR